MKQADIVHATKHIASLTFKEGTCFYFVAVEKGPCLHQK